MIKRLCLIWMWSWPLWAVLTAQSTGLQRAVDLFAKDPSLAHANVSVCMLDARTGQKLAGFRSEQSAAPASSLKVLTTSTALAVLGVNYTFRTELQCDGDIDADGVLRGNLIIRGSGDPTLGSPQMEGVPGLDALMERLGVAVQQKGIRRITGYIIADASCFNTEVSGASWQWIDMGNYYGAGAWGLNIHENMYYLRFRQTDQVGETPDIALVEPDIPELVFNNEVSSAPAGTGDNAYIYGAPFTGERYVRGTIPVGRGTFSIKGSMPDPPLTAARYLNQRLKEVGIVCEKGPGTLLELSRNGLKTGTRRQLYAYYSPSLAEIVKRTNLQSVNLYCEAMLRAIGLARKQQGSPDTGLEVIRDYWRNKGLDMSGVFLEDGSGLSPHNAVNSHFMAALMSKIYQDKALYEVINASLPVAGKSGGLKSMLNGTSAEGKLRAKTGTLNRVRSFTGYAPDRNGKLIAFSIIVNNYTGSGSAIRDKMEKLMKAICDN